MKRTLLVIGTVAVLCAILFCVKFIAVQPQESAAPSPVPETAELRMLVVDEKNNPVPNTLVRLKIDGGREFSWTTNEEGRIVGNIPLEWIMWGGPYTAFSIINREKALTSTLGTIGDGLEIPKDWKLGDPIEMTYTVRKAQRITGIVIDQDGKPVADAFVYGVGHHTTTDKEGTYELFAQWRSDETPMLAALHPTLGLGVSPGPLWFKRRAMLPDIRVVIQLVRYEPFRVKVVNPEGNPIEGALVSPMDCSPIDIYKNKEVFLDRVCREDGAHIPTDRDGMAVFHWIPPVKSMDFYVRGTDPQEEKESPARFYGFNSARWQAEKKDTELKDAELVIRLPKKVMLEGSVRFEDGSIPEQRPLRFYYSVRKPSADRDLKHYHSHFFVEQSSLPTDYNGNFVFFEEANTVVSLYPDYYDPYAPEGWGIRYQPRSDKPLVAPAMLRVNVGDGTKPSPRFDFILKPGAKVSGKLLYSVSSLSIWEMRSPDDTATYDLNARHVFETDDDKPEYEILLPPGWYRFIQPGPFDEDPRCDAVLEIREEDRNKNVRFDFDTEGKGTVTRESANR